MKRFNQVKKTIETYIEGSKRLDYDMVTSVVHPDARLFAGNDDLSKNLYEHWKTDFARHRERYSPEEFSNMWGDKIEILSIEVDGSIARAKLTSGWWIDYYSLVLLRWFVPSSYPQ